ncbi:MAG TPA: cytochrome c [Anaeromyxobacteraceae bacterium]|nr:cytochrome c [Anaeromyxobacteraceae bacterium]
MNSSTIAGRAVPSTSSGRAGRLLLPLLLLATTACPRLDPMQQQQKVEAYEASEWFSDGLGMRRPPVGTVQYRKPLDPVLAQGLGRDGRPVQAIPVSVDEKLLARGRTRFDVHCAVCHGVLGDGESQVALNMSLRRPPSLHLEQYRGVPDGYLYGVVTNGFGLMPGYGAELSVEDRWAVVAYVRALQLSQNAPLDLLPPEERARLEKEGR